MQDDLNQGMPSMEWWIKKDEVERPRKYVEKCYPSLIKIIRDAEGYLVPKELELLEDFAEGLFFVPVPSNFQTLKKNNSGLAVAPRMSTEKVFTYYFIKGWTVVDLFRSKSAPDLCYYVLKKV